MVLPAPVEVPTAKVHLDPDNFRNAYELDSLLPSIRQYGILQPPGMWACPERDCFFTIWGNRRVLCAQKLGLETIWARVFPGPLQPGQADLLQLVENLSRVDLRPSEEAAGYKSLMEGQKLNATQLAALLSISNSKVTKKLALLDLVPVLLARVDSGELPETAGYELSKLDPAAQADLAESFSGRITREAINARLGKEEKRKGTAKRHWFKRESCSLSVRDGLPLKAVLADLDELRRLLIEGQKQGREIGEIAGSPATTAPA